MTTTNGSSSGVPATTDRSGIPVESDEHSLTVGPSGPLLLQDVYLVQKMAAFNRERIPERVVHAKGSGAFGHFEVTQDVTRYTCAKVFQPGKTTEMLARFSTVAGELGSPDTWRDPRGFSLKFYTEDGNWDMVGNNTPVFFMKDPMKFQDFIRSQKRVPGSALRDHDMQWDYWTLSPESAHQVTWLMGDRGIPKTWRHMNGYSSHTYMWLNADDEKFYVRYHFKTDQGAEFLTQHEADQMAAMDTDFHRRDLYERIDAGDHPSWTLYVQIIPEAEAWTYRINPFDLTKAIPHADYPLQEVGRMTLDRNPDDHFTQVEQAAFDVSNMVPGTGPSPDRMLQARVFSYADTHRYRIGPNYQELPVNRPHSEVHTYGKDGPMRHHNPPAPTYAPNSYGGPQAQAERGPFGRWHVDGGDMVRAAYEPRRDDDDWSQARALLNDVMDDDARVRFVDNVVGHLCNGVSEKVLERAFQYWKNVDGSIGERIEQGVREKKGTDFKDDPQSSPARESAKEKAASTR